MTLPIDPSHVRFHPSGQPQFEGDAQSARRLLEQMAVSLTSGTGVKSGYLSVLRSKDGGPPQLGLRRWRGANASTEQATALVKDLVAKGYGDQPLVQQALEAYLQQSGNRVGTKSFIVLVKSLADARLRGVNRARSRWEEPSPDHQVLRGMRFKGAARLDTDWFILSAEDRQSVDDVIAYVLGVLSEVRDHPDPMEGLQKLAGLYEHLRKTIDQAVALGMDTQTLRASLQALNEQMVHTQDLATQVRTFVADPRAALSRLAQSELGELRAMRDGALQVLRDKAAELKLAGASFYASFPGGASLEAAAQRHAQLARELEEAQAAALRAGEALYAKTQERLAALSQQWQAAVAAQPRQGDIDPGQGLDRALRDLQAQADAELQELRAGGADLLGPPDLVLAEYVAGGRWPEAFARLRELRGPGAAAALGQIARRLHPPGTDPDTLAAFAAQAFVADASCGLELARWLREHFDLAAAGSATPEALRQFLNGLGRLNPDLAREVIIGFAETGQRLRVLFDAGSRRERIERPIEPGVGFYAEAWGTSGADQGGMIKLDSFSLASQDLADSVGTIEGFAVNLQGARLAGAHLVFKLSERSVYPGVLFDLSTADSLPAQIRLDLSALRRWIEEYERMEIAPHMNAVLGSDKPFLSPEQREAGLLRMIERLPPSRPDLKTSMMRDVLGFLKEIDWVGDYGTCAALAATLLRDPFYLQDPSIRELLSQDLFRQAVLGALPHVSDVRLSDRGAIEFLLDLIEQADERKILFLAGRGSEMLNQMFVAGDELPQADPLRQRISALQRRYLNAPRQREMMELLSVTGQTSQAADATWQLEPGADLCLLYRDGQYAVTPMPNFRKALRSPERINWTDFTFMERQPQGEAGKLVFCPAGELASRLAALRKAFPLLRKGQLSPPRDGASDVVGMLFAGEEASGLRRLLLDGFRHKAGAASPVELSERLRPFLEPVMRFDPALNSGGPVGVSREHYLQLLQHAASLGFGSDAASFARYLHALSASFALLSSAGALGDEDSSVYALRMYALALHREARHLGRLEPSAFSGHEDQMERIEADFTNVGYCAQLLSGHQAEMIKKLDARLAATVMPPRLVGDDLVQVLGAIDAQALAQEQARNAALVRDLRAPEGEPVGEVRAPMQFAQGALLEPDDGAAYPGPDFSQPDFLATELTARMDELGAAPEQMQARDPIVRLRAAAMVQAMLAPLAQALAAARAHVDAQLAQSLRALDAQRSRIESEQPAQGSNPLAQVRFERDRQFRLESLPEAIQAARTRAERQLQVVKDAAALLQDSAAVLAQGPGQA